MRCESRHKAVAVVWGPPRVAACTVRGGYSSAMCRFGDVLGVVVRTGRIHRVYVWALVCKHARGHGDGYLWKEPCLKKRRSRKGAVVCLSILAGAWNEAMIDAPRYLGEE
jgi:hypothetical protein